MLVLIKPWHADSSVATAHLSVAIK